jgi:hypothetical protein
MSMRTRYDAQMEKMYESEENDVEVVRCEACEQAIEDGEELQKCPEDGDSICSECYCDREEERAELAKEAAAKN